MTGHAVRQNAPADPTSNNPLQRPPNDNPPTTQSDAILRRQASAREGTRLLCAGAPLGFLVRALAEADWSFLRALADADVGSAHAARAPPFTPERRAARESHGGQAPRPSSATPAAQSPSHRTPAAQPPSLTPSRATPAAHPSRIPQPHNPIRATPAAQPQPHTPATHPSSTPQPHTPAADPSRATPESSDSRCGGGRTSGRRVCSTSIGSPPPRRRLRHRTWRGADVKGERQLCVMLLRAQQLAMCQNSCVS